jgi:hypothetical protein
MITFFDCKGPLLVEFLEHWVTINVQRYEDTLQKLRRAIKSKSPGMLPNGIILLDDNARLHTADFVRITLQRDIRGHWFVSDEDVCGWVKMWFRRQAKKYFKDGIDRLLSQWDKCINSFVDYFEVRNIL